MNLELTQRLESADKDIRTVIITIFNMLKKKWIEDVEDTKRPKLSF